MRFTLAISLLLFLFSCCVNNSNNIVPTDQEMLKFFLSNKQKFEKLKEMVEADSIKCYPSLLSNTNETEKVIERIGLDSLMRELQILRVSNLSNITFEYYTGGGVLWSVYKNYIYVSAKIDSTMKICPTDIDMNRMRTEINANCVLYKPLNDGWYLELIYDK